MNVKGNAYQTTNVRSVPKVITGNIVGKLYNGNVFTGSSIVVGSENWIKLGTVNGSAVQGDQYVAAWVVNSEPVDVTPPAEDDEIVGATVVYASGKTVPLIPVP